MWQGVNFVICHLMINNNMITVQCITCKKITTSKGIYSHYLHSHGSVEQQEKMKKGTKAINDYAVKNNAARNKAQSEKSREEKMSLYYERIPKCLYCHTDLTFDKRKNKFCNKSCSASYNNINRLPETYEKQRMSIFRSLGLEPTPKKEKKNKSSRSYFRSDGPYTRIYGNNCACCDKWFWSTTPRKTCSPECQRKNSTYRKIVIEYFHNNEVINLESSWELEIAKWLDQHQIEWVRPKHIEWRDSRGKLRRYFPDFYLPMYNVYLDPKNSYQIKISQEKLNAISNSNILFYGKVDFIKSQVENLISK